MAYIRVVYKAKEGSFDYVPGDLLDLLIAQDEISHFYRPSERRWVNTRLDAVIGGGVDWHGPERRGNGSMFSPLGQQGEKIPLNADARPANWLESLWRVIETF